MKRRRLIGYGAGAAGTAALVSCTPNAPSTESTSAALPAVQWRMAASWPQSLDVLYGAAQLVCDRVAALTSGRFTIDLFAAGEIVPALQVLDSVQTGAVECGHTASYYYLGKNPALAFGTAVPFGLNAQQQNAWFYHGGGLELMQNLYSDFGVINFPAGNTGTQMGGWFKREINSLSDLAGLKMRIPGMGGEVMQRLGVNVQVIPGGEIYLALERGAVDAAEWVGPHDDEKLGLQDTAQFYYYPGWWEPGASLEVQINRSSWDSLPSEYQAALQTACYEANLNMLSAYESLNGAALQRLIDQGTLLKPYTEDILAAGQTAAFELYEDNAAQDATFKQVYEQWSAFRSEILRWNSINQFKLDQFIGTSNVSSP
jgi:TRAP-type mannitol/chloroaromatic compound transport system substrate-binding protein